MTQSALAMKCHSGTPAAYRMVGATPVQIGAAFGSAESVPASIDGYANRVIKFYNNQTSTNRVQLCAWIRDEIYSYNEANGWTSRATLSGTSNVTNQTGLFLINNSGIPTLVGAYENGANFHWHTIQSTDGLSWTDTDLGAIQNNISFFKALIFNNVIYESCSTTNGHFSWDIPNSSHANINDANVSASGQDMCVFGGTLYKIGENASINGYLIDALVSGSWTTVCTLPVDGATGLTTMGNKYSFPVLFDGGDGFLYALYKLWSDSSDYGYACAQITASGITVTATSISSIVLPASLRYATSGRSASTPGAYRFRVLVETVSQPGSPIGPTAAIPTIHIYATVSSADAVTGMPWNYWVWNGPATLIGNGGAPNDTGGDASIAMPNTSQGNDRIWYPGDFSIDVLSAVGIGTNIKIQFSVFGPVGTEVKNALFYFSVDGQQPKYVTGIGSVGIVSGPGSTPTVGGDGHHVQNLTADGNTVSPTIYYAMWPATTEISPGPITSNEKVGIAARVY